MVLCLPFWEVLPFPRGPTSDPLHQMAGIIGLWVQSTDHISSNGAPQDSQESHPSSAQQPQPNQPYSFQPSAPRGQRQSSEKAIFKLQRDLKGQ